MQNQQFGQNQDDYNEQFIEFQDMENNMFPPSQPYIYSQNPAPKKSKRSKLSIIILIISSILIIGAMIFVSNLIIERINNTDNHSVSDTETYNMKDRPRYTEMIGLINKLYDKYTKQDLTGEIWDRFDSSTEDYNYVIDFLSELNYYHSNLEIFDNQQSSSSSELDYEIETNINILDELETNFIAKAPLTTTITITLEDGTKMAVAKKTNTSIRYSKNSNDKEQMSALLDSAPLEKEAWARNFDGSIDSHGTYRTSAAQLVERFDMYLDYNWANILNKCIGSSANEKSIIAAYCHATPDIVYINKNSTNYKNNIKDIKFVSTIKHEISHHIIATICGTAQPTIAGANYEGVTNSYANIFLGAKEKNEYYKNHPEYQMSKTTDSIARAIHDENRCKK